MSKKNIERKKDVPPENTRDLAIEWLFQGRASERVESHYEEKKSEQSTKPSGLLFISRSESINNRFNYLIKNDSDSKLPIFIIKDDDDSTDSKIIRLHPSSNDEFD